MAVSVTLNSNNYSIPQVGDSAWGTSLTNYLVAISTSVLQKSGGAFTLTAETDFGANFGLRSLYLRTRASSPATTGEVRMGNTESIVWRNAANSANLALSVNASDVLVYNSVPVLASAASGIQAFLTTPSSANLLAAVSDETGSGALVFATSPTLVTPVLGTPASGTLTNCTLPVGGITGLGTGIATFLATPSSANLLAAVTDETGSGSLVFGTSPTLSTPALSGPTFSTSATVTAGTNAQGQGALTSDINVVTTTSANPSGVTLPTATTGRRVSVINRGTNPINVYPASGGAINGLGTNNPISVPVNSQIDVGASSTTQWYSLGSAGGGLDPVERSTTLNPAVAGTLYLCDTSGGGFSITLPLGTSKASIGFADARETFATGNLTIIPASGQAIDGQPTNESLVLDVSGSWVTLTWNVANSRWVIQSSAPGSSNQAIVQNGNTLGAAMTIGTNDNFGVDIETNGTTKLGISAAGAVTVGPSSGAVTVNHQINAYTSAFTYGNTSLTINNRNGSNAATIAMASNGALNSAWYSSSGFPFAVTNSSGTDIVFASSAGAWTFPLIHNITTGNLNSGRYTPTITGVANVASSGTNSAMYSRVGNVVTVSGYLTITPTTSSTNTAFRINLPIASNLASGVDLGGAAALYRSGASTGVMVTGDSANDAAFFDYVAPTNTLSTVSYTFQYEVK